MMELDDLKSEMNNEKQMASNIDRKFFKDIKTNVSRFDKKTKINTIIESLVAAIAFISVLVMLIKGPSIYPVIIDALLPGQFKNIEPEFNVMMYISLMLMAVYCLLVPIKLHLANKDDNSLNWSLTSRVDSEISKLEKQNKLWSQAHLWAFIPSATIGILFFWGLQISLLDTWIPNFYLSTYLAFIVLASYGGIWMKNQMTAKQIQPLLDKLYSLREQLYSANI